MVTVVCGPFSWVQPAVHKNAVVSWEALKFCVCPVPNAKKAGSHPVRRSALHFNDQSMHLGEQGPSRLQRLFVLNALQTGMNSLSAEDCIY